jgi:transcriptional regulator with XRE-family HTH domain
MKACMIDLASIGQAVRQRRRDLGLTQQQLAERAKVARNRIAPLETDRLPDIGFNTLIKILRALELDLRLTTLNRRRPTLEDLRAEADE